MADKQAQLLQKSADRIADALEHMAFAAPPSDSMLDNHRDDCPLCGPVRAQKMLDAAKPPEPPPVGDEVHAYGDPPPAPSENEDDEPGDPETPVEVGH